MTHASFLFIILKVHNHYHVFSNRNRCPSAPLMHRQPRAGADAPGRAGAGDPRGAGVDDPGAAALESRRR